MAEVKWIKITTDMFDNRKIKHLRKLPDGNNIVLIWVMLITMAGRCNAGGMIFLTERIPYTEKMLADELGFEETTVRLALQAFEEFNMVVRENEYLKISGWDEYQNIDGLDKIREQNRLRQQKRRSKQKQAMIGSGNVCEYCGKDGNTVDHIIPKSKGGLDNPENTVCSCLACNMSKTDRDIAVFLNEKIVCDDGFDVSMILSNKKIMKFVDYQNGLFVSRGVTGQVTLGNGTDKEKEIDIEKEKEKIDLSINLPKEQKSMDRLIDSATVSDIKDQIDYDGLTDRFDADLLDIVVSCIADLYTATTAQEFNDRVYSVEFVQKRSMEINAMHIEYVLECFEEQRERVHNIRKYLKTSIFNAPDTMGAFYTNKVRADGAVW